MMQWMHIIESNFDLSIPSIASSGSDSNTIQKYYHIGRKAMDEKRYISKLMKYGLPKSVENIDIFDELSETNSMICLTNAKIVDAGQTLLQFTNQTALYEKQAPMFSRDAQAMKERVWSGLGLEGQVPLELIFQNEILHLKSAVSRDKPIKMGYIHRRPPSSTLVYSSSVLLYFLF